MKKLVITGFALLACVPAANAAQETPQPDPLILRDITSYRNQTWHYQRTMGVARSPYWHLAARKQVSTNFRLMVRRLWRSRAASARKQFLAGPPHLSQWRCIHRYEGSWRDSGAPYWGGLQMDMSFMSTYGSHLLRRKGTADHWTPLEQMWVAEKAHRSGRGFGPWPNTARACGLSV